MEFDLYKDIQKRTNGEIYSDNSYRRTPSFCDVEKN